MIPKKVFIALPSISRSAFLSGLVRAFAYLQIDTHVFDYRAAPTFEKFQAMINSSSDRLTRSINERLAKGVKAYQPDILLVMKGETITSGTITSIKKLGITTVNWFPDDIQNFKIAEEQSKYYDYFFHFDPYALSLLKKPGRKNVYYLPFAADILPGDTEPRYIDADRKIPISFVGNYYPRREKYLLAIKDLKPSIWGDKRWEESKLAKYYRGYRPIKEILPKIKIAVNIQYDSPCQGLVLRVYEVLGSKGFLLTDARSETKKLFHPGQDLVTFTTTEDFRQKVQSFLKTSQKREEIAARGYAKVRDKHTYVHRLKEIFKLLDANHGKV